MAQATTDATGVQAAPVQAERALRRRRPLLRQPALLAALGFLALIVLAAILAPWIAPHNPLQQDLGARVAGPSGAHLLGTDDVGRDVLSRLIWGTRPVLDCRRAATLASSGSASVIRSIRNARSSGVRR